MARPARQNPPRPGAPSDYGTGPVVLLLEAACLSELEWPLKSYVLLHLGGVGLTVYANYFLYSLALVLLTAGGMWLRRRMRARPVRRGRSKVIPFPEHRRRRGA